MMPDRLRFECASDDGGGERAARGMCKRAERGAICAQKSAREARKSAYDYDATRRFVSLFFGAPFAHYAMLRFSRPGASEKPSYDAAAAIFFIVDAATTPSFFFSIAAD